MFLTGLIIGLIIGGCLGVGSACWLVAAGDSDREMRRYYHESV